ncbi:MopE-related protein [Corallococcus sp. BB11-1]|nr:MopE-related protein [Corallococcus sp. BB11-1]
MTALLALGSGCGESLLEAEPEAPLAMKVQQDRVVAGLEVQGVAAGAYHSLAVRSDGVVWSWGQNTDGQLGRGAVSATPQATPLPITLPRRMTAVAAGSGHSLALDETGHVWAWGRNSRGQAGGLNPNTRVLAPTQVPVLSNIIAISARADLSLAVDANGSVWAWGQNTDGELGQPLAGPDSNAHPTPVQVVIPALAPGDPYLPQAPADLTDPAEVTKIVSVAAGGHHVLALGRTGRVWGWGRNDFAQVGTGASSAPVLTPTLIRTWVTAAIAAGEFHSVLYDNEVPRHAVSWGLNGSGQGGRDFIVSEPPLLEQFLPSPAGAVPNTAAGGYIAAGDHFSLFVQGYPFGDLVGWGANESGQLGDGTQLLRPTPGYALRWDSYWGTHVRVDSVALVAGGARHGLSAHFERWEYQGCPIVWSWGDNSQGQLGTGSLSPALVKYVQPGLPLRLFYRDQDGDGHGSPADFLNACALPDGFVTTALDCDDTNAAFKPGATEVCDGVDNNCDGQVDEGVCAFWYRDADGDGYGKASDAKRSFTQPQGYVADSTDCDDTRANVRPGQAETCDTLDNDCDGQVDEGVCAFWYRDADGDGYGKASDSVQAGTQPQGYVANSTDCDDTRANVSPGASEVCDGLDNNCNGQPDEGVGSNWYRDADGDGYGTSSQSTQACSQPSGYVANTTDCDDTRPNVSPGASEVCDGLDNNCNGQSDEGVGGLWYRDADGDGYGNPGLSAAACGQPSGYVSNASDCNDSNAGIRPGATEVCDGVDNNCSGAVDEGVKPTWYRDADGDNYGVSSQSTQACSRPTGYAASAGDCNDSNSGIHPGAYDSCDGIDNNCNGSWDEDDSGSTWYRDADGDGYGNPNNSTDACSRPSGYVSNASDCNDSNSSVRPGATEYCDGVDNNCNGSTDEGVKPTWYFDSDGDGYGVGGLSIQACTRPTRYASVAGDCNDSNPNIRPGAPEVCDGVDNNCNYLPDDGVGSIWYRDADGDGYGSNPTTQACSKPSGYVATSGDCNDSNAATRPGAPEICDWQDNNCNGQSDEGVGIWYRDADNDGYGNGGVVGYGCVQPGGYVANASDCNDSNASMNPGHAEICDGVDNNCNGQTNEGGVCVPTSCDPGYALCGGTCINVMDDFDNCGGCGLRCPNWKFECIEGDCIYM